MFSDKSYKCAFCQVLIEDEEEFHIHQETCDRVYLFPVEILDDCSGSINLRRYEFHKGEIPRLWFDLVRQLESQGYCRRL